MPSPSAIDNISIILVDTKTPANIGATARVMMNMGLRRLILVNPPADPDQEAFKLAAGAHEVLEKADTFDALADALSGHNFALATSRHAGRLRQNILPPRSAAEMTVPLLADNRVAVVFGNEVNGLENHDLALCQQIIAIPSSADFPSLNLSHAVMIVAYELYAAAAAPSAGPDAQQTLADIRELELFYTRLQDTLQTIGFIDRDNPERMMFSFRQLFGKARLNSREVSILQGVLSDIDRKIRSKN